MQRIEVLLVLIFTVCVPYSFASSILSRRINRMELKDDTAVAVAAKVDIPMCIEMVSSMDASQRKKLKLNASVSMTLNDVSLSQALDQICKKTESEWTEDEGVINIYPGNKNARADIFLNRKTSIDSINQDREDILEDVFKKWRVQDPAILVISTSMGISVKQGSAVLSLVGVKTIGLSKLQTMEAKKALPHHSFSLRDRTLRRLLNEIARRDHVVWWVLSSNDGKKVVLGFGNIAQ